MKVKTITIYFTLLIVAAAIGYDFYAIAVGGTEASISHIIKVWGHKYPIISFSLGALFGHFFWPIKSTKDTKKIDEMIRELDE